MLDGEDLQVVKEQFDGHVDWVLAMIVCDDHDSIDPFLLILELDG